MLHAVVFLCLLGRVPALEATGEIARDATQTSDAITGTDGALIVDDPTALTTLLARLRSETGLSIWCYTGYTVEYLLQSEAHRPALEFIDVLVDGPFVQSLLDPRLYFRGSRNQRLVHIDHSLPLSAAALSFLDDAF